MSTKWVKTKIGCGIIQGIFILESIFLIPLIWAIPCFKMCKKIIDAETDEEQYNLTNAKKWVCIIASIFAPVVGWIASILIIIDIYKNRN